MATPSTNPYRSPSRIDEEAKPTMPTKRRSRWHGFKTGFRNGTLWSLLLVVPTVPAFYGEMTLGRSVELSPSESALVWLSAIGTALTGITLPWAITAGCVGQARYRRKNAHE